VTHPVFIEKDQGDAVKATMIGWPGLSVSAATRQEALAKLQELLRQRLASGEVVQLDIELPETEDGPFEEGEAEEVNPDYADPTGDHGPPHPWLESAGIFENNPLFDEVLEEIEAYRRQIDAKPRKK